jgi:hypothetical protein
MSERKYPELFYKFALSGKCLCKICRNRIKQGQDAFEYKGNVYHDICSQDLKERVKIND